MSYAAFKMVHSPTGVEHCAAAYLTHTAGHLDTTDIASFGPHEFGYWGGGGVSATPKEGGGGGSGSGGLPPNLVVAKANLLEVYHVRVLLEGDERTSSGGASSNNNGNGASSVATAGPIHGTLGKTEVVAARGSSLPAAVSSVKLELACSYRLHGNVESLAVLSHRREECRRRRDAIVLAFRDAKIAVLEFDDSTHGLRASSLHYFEGPEWQHLKRGRESFPCGPIVRADTQGRCAGVLVYTCQMVILKASQVGYGLGEEEEGPNLGGIICAHIESSYVVSLRDLDMKFVKDFVFLHGYTEPVVVVLHEKEPTWAGRVAVRRHTCAITALSINTTLRQHPLIWSATNLPYDAYKLLAVPSPIGGVLVLCANTIHYHSQSTSCALALNEFAVAPEGSPDFPKSKITVELDTAHAAWVSHDVALLSTKTGNLLLLSLVYDGRSVQNLELSRSKASVLASCMCMVGDKCFFLGSRLADSLLVQYTAGNASAGTPGFNYKPGKEEGDIEGDISVPAAKRLKQAASDPVQEGVSVEEMSLYYSSPTSSDTSQKKTFSFAVMDSLVNIGPLRDLAYGLRSNADAAASGLSKQSNYELVACSGHGKNGSLSVLHQSIRPDLITEVELPGCTGIWTVYHKAQRDSASDVDLVTSKDEEFHAYLIISLGSRTMVLETGDTLGEVTESVEYYTEGGTIIAGNLFGRHCVVQVFDRGLRLLDGAIQMQELLIERPEAETNGSVPSTSNLVVGAAIADPFVVLKMADGALQLVVGDPATSTMTISSPSSFASNTDLITAFSLYQDKGPYCWLRRACKDSSERSQLSTAPDQGKVFCIICRQTGRLEIYELPHVTCVFSVENFNYGMSVLWDNKVSEKRVSSNAALRDGAEEDETAGEDMLQEAASQLLVTQVCFERWGEKFGRPFLLATLSDGTMLCYHAFCYEVPETGDALEYADSLGRANAKETPRLGNLRFVRMPIDWVSGEDEGAGEKNPTLQFYPFRNVGSMSGVFVTGSRPAWLMICRQRIRCHPQFCDGAILGFTPLHNVNCTHGFIYVTAEGLLKICQLPSLLFYDNDWAVQKIPLRGTPHQVTYHPDVNLYALITSTPSSWSASQVMAGEASSGNYTDQQTEESLAEDGQKLVTSEEFEVRIIEPAQPGSDWETKASIKMHMTENALTVRIVNIRNIITDQTQTMLAIGTAYVQGEDVAAKGRIILVSVGQGTNDPSTWAREVYSKELKGAISAIASLQGHLLIAIGPKIILHTWNGSELNGAAFFDAPLYVVSLNIVKNFVLFGDIHKSIYFLCWKEDGAQLTLLAKDFGALDCYTTEFLIDGSTLSLLVSDSHKNLQIFSYAPKSVESWKGQKLLPRAEFHLGAHVAKFLRLQMLPTASTARSNRFAVLFGTLDGAIDYLAPVDELTFRRLQTLQRKLVDSVAHVAGLNPRAFRQFRCDGKAHRPGPDNIVDCELLSHYEMLALDEQLEIARQIGTTRAHVLTNLRDLALSTSFL